MPEVQAGLAQLSAEGWGVREQSFGSQHRVISIAGIGLSKVQAVTSSATLITLSESCRAVSMYSTQGAWWDISGTATSSSHYIGAGERLDFGVPAGSSISVLRETVDGSIRLTELV